MCSIDEMPMYILDTLKAIRATVIAAPEDADYENSDLCIAEE